MVFPWTILPDYKLWCYSTKLFPEIISMYQLLAKKNLLPESAASKNPCVQPESLWPHMSQENNISGGCFSCSQVERWQYNRTLPYPGGYILCSCWMVLGNNFSRAAGLAVAGAFILQLLGNGGWLSSKGSKFLHVDAWSFQVKTYEV